MQYYKHNWIHIWDIVEDVVLTTVISKVLAVLVAFILLMRKNKFCIFCKPQRSAMIEIIKLGISL